MNHRPITEIAADIRANWLDIDKTSERFLAVLEKLDDITDTYRGETASEVALRFLISAEFWRGPAARSIKNELAAIVHSYRRTETL
jgi:hypothetical protein